MSKLILYMVILVALSSFVLADYFFIDDFEDVATGYNVTFWDASANFKDVNTTHFIHGSQALTFRPNQAGIISHTNNLLKNDSTVSCAVYMYFDGCPLDTDLGVVAGLRYPSVASFRVIATRDNDAPAGDWVYGGLIKSGVNVARDIWNPLTVTWYLNGNTTYYINNTFIGSELAVSNVGNVDVGYQSSPSSCAVTFDHFRCWEGESHEEPIPTGEITSCGDTITIDSYLTQNITCSGTDGVTFGATDIELDCRGFSIIGDSSGQDGVVMAFDDTKLKNCHISLFNNGVLSTADYQEIDNNTVFNNSVTDISLTGTDYSNITDNIMYGTSGISLGLTTVTNSNFNYNTITKTIPTGDEGSRFSTNTNYNSFSFNNITGGGSAITFILGANYNTFYKDNLTGLTNGMIFYGADYNNFTNSYIRGITKEDMLFSKVFSTPQDNWFINCTTNLANFSILNDANITIADYSRVHVHDNASVDIIGANITIYDSFNQSFTTTTYAEGDSPFHIMRWYTQFNSTHPFTVYLNYTINVSKQGFFDRNGISWSPLINETQSVTMNPISNPEVYSMFPVNDDYNDTMTIDFIFNVSSYDIHYCILNTNEFGGSTKRNTTPILNATPHTIDYTFLTDGEFEWFVWCNNTQGNFSQSETRNITIDSVDPICTGFTNETISNSSNYNWNVTCTDSHFFSLNITCSGSDNFTYFADGLDTTSFNFINTTPIYSQVTCEYEACDGHTDNYIGNIEVGAEISNNTRTFDNKITLTVNKIFESFELEFDEKKKDRYYMIMNFSLPSDRASFTIESDEYIHIMDSEAYLGWLILGNYWVDFESEKVQSVKVLRVTDTAVQVDLTFYKSVEDIKFSSIGKLNCITGDQIIGVGTPVGGWYFNQLTCPLGQDLPFVLGYFGVLALLFVLLIMNEVFFRLPIFNFIVGIGFFFVSLPLYACFIMFGIITSLFGLFIWIAEILRLTN